MVDNRPHALVDAADAVVSIILWDGQTPWQPPPGLTACACPANVGPGWRRVGEAFLPPDLDAEQPAVLLFMDGSGTGG